MTGGDVRAEDTGFKFDTQQRPRLDLLEPNRGEHVWVAAAVFRIAPETLRSGGQGHLDRENLATIEVGCYVCEQPYSERLSYRKCAGDPGGSK